RAGGSDGAAGGGSARAAGRAAAAGVASGDVADGVSGHSADGAAGDRAASAGRLLAGASDLGAPGGLVLQVHGHSAWRIEAALADAWAELRAALL
ncbi:hypothetical protein, partial [Paenibacillus koleovorans]|uniref:hypothetical protein n=1 Tax=Paenibacillus koleovorans TaxID=121608 RepID=UPI001C3FD5B8